MHAPDAVGLVGAYGRFEASDPLVVGSATALVRPRAGQSHAARNPDPVGEEGKTTKSHP